MDGKEVDSLIDSLETRVRSLDPSHAQWKPLWDLIRSIGASFKQVRYGSKKEREAAWERFQGLVQRVKVIQEREFQSRERANWRSEQHKNDILECARKGTPPNALEEIVGAVAWMPFGLLERAIDSLLPGPPTDPVKEELQHYSRELAKGWQLLSTYKNEMRGHHKKEAFDAMNKAKELLDLAWESWRRANHQAYEARRQEKQAKQAAWEARVRANIDKLETRIAKLASVLAHKESHLEQLEEKRNSARSDDFRSTVESWIDEEEEAIRDIRATIRQVEGWLDEERAKLS